MKKELPYIALSLVLLYTLLGFPVSINTLLQDSTLDINFYDTYLVIEGRDYIIFSFVFAFVSVYFMRVLVTKFQHRIANYIYLIFNVLFMVILGYITQLFYVISQGFEINGVQHNTGLSKEFYFFSFLFLVALAMEIYTIMRVRKQS